MLAFAEYIRNTVSKPVNVIEGKHAKRKRRKQHASCNSPRIIFSLSFLARYFPSSLVLLFALRVATFVPFVAVDTAEV